jgi:hypothetical protein
LVFGDEQLEVPVHQPVVGTGAVPARPLRKIERQPPRAIQLSAFELLVDPELVVDKCILERDYGWNLRTPVLAHLNAVPDRVSRVQPAR